MATTELAVVGDVVGIEEGSMVEASMVEASMVEASIENSEIGQVAARRNQRGMVSAEWAVGIIAAVALAGVLIAVITNGPVQDALLKFVLQVIRSFSGYIIG
jgi:Protein of unknown function (DUF4244)